MAHGLDHFFTGIETAWSGVSRETVTSQLLQQTGVSHQTAGILDDGISIFGTMGGAASMVQTNSGRLLSKSMEKIVKSEIGLVGKEKKIFPKNPKDLLSEALRDKKGYIYACDKIRIKPEQHLLKHGEIYNSRHHGQHYHIEIRTDVSKSWNNEKYTYYLQPSNYQKGTGTGFIPGETFPGN